MRSLRGKTAVITGAASGIGRALAHRCAREGMHVVLADLDKRGLKKAAEEIPGSLAVRTDVASMGQVQALASKAYARFGAVHLLCNNAGIAEHGPLWELPLSRWRRVLAVNLWGAIHGCLAFVPRMLAQGQAAHVVNTASMAGLVTPPSAGAYSVSKHGVVALSEALVQDLATRGARIGVSVLCPGWVQTRIARSTKGADAVMRSLVAHGLPPEMVAEQTLRAVRDDRFYILTHPAMARAVQRRTEDILAGRAPPLALFRRRARSQAG
ncbi:MAG: SDR family NAD(P)-dependent oxidoreductase [Deltaproteobacteria bacterium]|nr:MAG: SDR family NAD(P)-dependent oxidoreductase [Deltaproteobacteria bacterium]